MKIRVAAMALAAGLTLAGAARADDIFTTGLYTVIGYSGAYPDFKHVAGVNTPSYLDGVEADGGWRFNRFYSIEGSYSYFTGSTNPASGTSFTNTLQDGSIDALGYLPLGPWRSWALYADVGGTWYFESASTVSGSDHADRFGGRAGGGVQYQFEEDIGIRAGGRYDWANLPNMKSATVFSVGLVWQR
ncbi:MAG TPA: outer membrane beta-barrel protein [Rhizomicrobium sp.]|nr:outer membrane beta-barrel protein [Rhizomicrobium sp.]